MLTSRRDWLQAMLASGMMVPWSITRAGSQEPVKVALLESVFAGQDRDKVVEQIKPFADIIQKDTKTEAVFDVMSLPQAETEFKTGKIQLVILTGLEYAWLQAGNPEAKALLVASTDEGTTRTVVVTKESDVAKDLKELSGAKLAIPDRVPFVSQYYLESTLGQPLEKAFQIKKAGNVDDTLEEVLDGNARAAIVTGAGMEVFKERKPGRFKKLKAVHTSIDFPPATVMYHEKYADKDALAKFKDALLKSNEKPEGARVLTLYKLKGFEVVPAGFEQKVQEVAKAFPRKG